MNTLNGCAWKGGKLHISQAKPNRFKTLEDGRVSIINLPSEDEKNGEKQKIPKKKRKLVRMSGDQSLVTDKNVDKRKGWRRGRYGRAIACLRIRKPNRQLLIVDPSHYKNNLEKLFGSVRPKPLPQLTWTITEIRESDYYMGVSEPIECETQINEFTESEYNEAVECSESNEAIELADSYETKEIVNSNEIVDIESSKVVDEDMSIEEPVSIEAENMPEPAQVIEARSEPEVKTLPASKPISIPVPEINFEVNVNWSSLFAPSPSANDSSIFGSSFPNQSSSEFSLNSLIGKKLKTNISAEDMFKKPVAIEEVKAEQVDIGNGKVLVPETSASSTNNKKIVHNYANIFGDLNRITPTTATRFGMLLSQKDDMLHEWRVERVELKEDFKKRLAEGKRRNRRNKPGRV